MAERTLILMRHAKADDTSDQGDLMRPLAKRGRRQGRESARWIAAHVEKIHLAVVSSALRTQRTWDLVAEELADPPAAHIDDRIYGASADGLMEVINELPPEAMTVVLIGHNPAIEEVAARLTGEWAAMSSSALAVIELDRWSTAGEGSGLLKASGRPPED
jgi:phosphohistidine phosphatase